MKKTKNVINERIFPGFCGEIVKIVRDKLSPKVTAEQICRYHEKDVALSLELLTAEELSRIFKLLPPKYLADVFEYAEDRLYYFGLLEIRRKAELLSYMEASEAAEILQKSEKKEREALLEILKPEIQNQIKMVCAFDEEEIGSRMSANFIKISDKSAIKEAMSQLIREAAEKDNISMLYVVDELGVFCGAIALNDLIVAREGTALSEITTFSYPYLYAKNKIEDCITFITEYAEASIPVLDDDNRMIGVVTAQDFVELIDDELGDDYAKLGGLSSEEDLSETVIKSVKKRMPWLAVLLVMGLGVSATVQRFEGIVARLPVIMCFQSLILDMAGNVGTQSLAVAIRVLMDSKIGSRQKAGLVWKEMRIGFLNGSILGILSFAVIGIYLCLIGNTVLFSFSVSACLGSAMILAMVVSALSGTLIPIFFKRIGIDPAVASGPLITTVNDLVAVVTYYGLAWLILLKIMKFV